MQQIERITALEAQAVGWCVQRLLVKSVGTLAKGHMCARVLIRPHRKVAVHLLASGCSLLDCELGKVSPAVTFLVVHSLFLVWRRAEQATHNKSAGLVRIGAERFHHIPDKLVEAWRRLHAVSHKQKQNEAPASAKPCASQGRAPSIGNTETVLRAHREARRTCAKISSNNKCRFPQWSFRSGFEPDGFSSEVFYSHLRTPLFVTH